MDNVTFCLSAAQLIHIWGSTFWLLWIMLWTFTFIYKFLCRNMFSFDSVLTSETAGWEIVKYGFGVFVYWHEILKIFRISEAGYIFLVRCPYDFLAYNKIYLFLEGRVRGRKRQRREPSSASSLPRWLCWPGLGLAETSRLECHPRLLCGAGTQVLRQAAAFPGALAKSQISINSSQTGPHWCWL